MIEIRELSFKYKGGSDYSLKDINLKIKKGECILLCGRSGCGKSTLLKLINGIIPEFYDGDISGRVMVNGMNTFTTPIYKLSKDVGSVFQNPKTQFYTTNTTDEIAFGLENYGIEREVINKRIEEVGKELHLENLMNKNLNKKIISIALSSMIFPSSKYIALSTMSFKYHSLCSAIIIVFPKDLSFFIVSDNSFIDFMSKLEDGSSRINISGFNA